MKLAHQEDDWEPPDPESERWLNTSVIPIAAGVKAANENLSEVITPKEVPLSVKGNVTSLHQIQEKKRSDFDSQVEYDIHRQLLRIQREADAETVRQLNQMDLEEGKDSDPVEPLAGADAVNLDDRARLDAYLAHYNPVGATRYIRTEPGYRTIQGETYPAPKRQDKIARKKREVSYPRLYRPRFVTESIFKDGRVVGKRIIKNSDGSQRMADAHCEYRPVKRVTNKWRVPPKEHGMVFWLSDDLQWDQKRAALRTKKSRRTREKLGKAPGTRYQNLAMIRSYRPTPSVQWFVEHPSGSGLIYDTPFPHGIVDHDTEAVMEHARRVSEWENVQVYCSRKAKELKKEGVSKRRATYLLMLIGEKAEYLNQWHRRAYAKFDDLPWGEPTPTPDRVDDMIRVAKEHGAYPVPEVMPDSEPQPIEDGGSAEAEVPVAMMHTPEVVDSCKFELGEPVVYVSSDGLALPPTRLKDDAARESVLNYLAGEFLRPHKENRTAHVSLDLTDPDNLPVIENQIQSLRDQVDNTLGHIENLVKAKMVLEHSIGVNSSYDAADQIWNQLDWDVQRIRVMSSKDLGLPEPRKKGKPASGFSKLLRTIERAERRNLASVNAWWDQYLDYVERKRSAREQMPLIRKANRLRVRPEVASLKRMALRRRSLQYLKVSEQEALAEVMEKILHFRRLRIPAEVNWLRSQAKPKRWKRVLDWHRREHMRKLKGKLKHRFKPRKQPVMATPPRVEPERPTKNKPRVPMYATLGEQAERVTPILTPEVEIVKIDTVSDKILAAHRQKLIQSGRFSREEIEEADQIFKPKMVHRFQESRDKRRNAMEACLVA